MDVGGKILEGGGSGRETSTKYISLHYFNFLYFFFCFLPSSHKIFQIFFLYFSTRKSFLIKLRGRMQGALRQKWQGALQCEMCCESENYPSLFRGVRDNKFTAQFMKGVYIFEALFWVRIPNKYEKYYSQRLDFLERVSERQKRDNTFTTQLIREQFSC